MQKLQTLGNFLRNLIKSKYVRYQVGASIVTRIDHFLSAHQMTSCAMTGESAFSGWKYVMVVPTVLMAPMRSGVSQKILLLSVSSRKLQYKLIKAVDKLQGQSVCSTVNAHFWLTNILHTRNCTHLSTT